MGSDFAFSSGNFLPLAGSGENEKEVDLISQPPIEGGDRQNPECFFAQDKPIAVNEVFPFRVKWCKILNG